MSNHLTKSKLIKQLLSIDSDGYISILKIFKRIKKEWTDVFPDRKQKIAIVGPVNTGKSTLFNLLIGNNVSDTSSMPGTTTESHTEDFGPFCLLDTPGASESIGLVRERKAFKAIEQSDFLIILFDNTFRGDGKILYEKIKRYNKPSVVAVNKVDLWKNNNELDRFIRHIALSLNIEEIIPISAQKEIGINRLMKKIISINPELVLNIAEYIPRYQRVIAHQFIATASASAGVVGMSPIPIADFFPLVAIQAGLIIKIAKIYGYNINYKRARELIFTFAGGVGFREIARQGLKLIPGYGWAVSGGIAAAGTYALGAVAVEFFNAERKLSPTDINAFFKSYFIKFKKIITSKIRQIGKKDISEEEEIKLLEAEISRIDDEAIEE